MSSKKKVLVLTPRYPYPPIGGDRLRIFYLCKELSKRFSLTLLSLTDRAEDTRCTPPGDGIFERIECIYLPRWRSILSTVRALPSSTPLQVAYYRSAAFGRRVKQLLSSHDLCLAHLIRTGDYVRTCDVPTVLEMTDAISLNYERVRNIGTRARRLQSLVYKLEESRLREYERSIVECFDLAVLVSDVDREYLFGDRQHPPGNVLVCTNGVEASSLPFSFERDGRAVIFIGNLMSVQNLDGALYFASEVLPKIRTRASDVTFRVVGRIRPGDAQRLHALDGVEVTGEVASIPKAIRGGGVGVCPIRLGAGIQNKVLEYMALGLPTVTTTLGREGLDARPGVEFIAADGPQGTADAVLDLLDDREKAEAMARSARRYVERSHSWAAAVAPMMDVIGRL